MVMKRALEQVIDREKDEASFVQQYGHQVSRTQVQSCLREIMIERCELLHVGQGKLDSTWLKSKVRRVQQALGNDEPSDAEDIDDVKDEEEDDDDSFVASDD